MMTEISSFFRLVRGKEWWYSKISPLLAIVYAEILLQAIPFHSAFVALVAVLVSVCSLAAYGYALNDFFDQQADYRAGKKNFIAQLPFTQGLSLCILTVATGFLPLFFLDFGRTIAMLLAVNYLFATIYSAPPLRLKEKGVWGVIVAAAAQRALPTLFVAIAFSNLVPTPTKENHVLIVSAVVWSFFVGLRWIIVHQLLDQANDVRSGVQTFVTKVDSERARRLLIRFLFPVEILMLGLFLALLCKLVPLLLCFVVVYGVTLVAKYRLALKVAFDQALVSFHQAPLSDLYEIWLPLVLAFFLAARNPLFLIVVALQIVLFYEHVKWRVFELVDLFNLFQRAWKSTSVT